MTPHVAQNTRGRSSAIDGRTTRHPGYAVSQRIRKRVEEVFGWMKTVGVPADPVSGVGPDWSGGALGGHAYNLMAKLLGQAAATPVAQMA